ncbi:hypothetical protein [Vibrio vulnificus]|uniref:hypothetical protein n=1 Tax=Vibrio vulnificus TaxID=672 RepID=UPI00193DB808|nr:hypothetical protein [Vibrio vulnificus]MBM4959270.1 hypothetical protein [Vibrio parahaemolyticus]MCG9655300.1 hypothetical protein [Vibrio vulnificus]
MNAKLAHFSEAMKGFQDKYILIGGNACALVFEHHGGEFRQTQDLDIVLVIEEWTKEFAEALWQYFSDGKYVSRKFHQGQTHGNVYRFVIPDESDTLDEFPKQIELFSRAPDDVELFEKAHLTPIETEEGVSNFSAILVDDDYYKLLKEAVLPIDTVNTVTHQCLTVLKAKAWIGNKQLFAEGKIKPEREGDVHKHAFDICRLLTLFEDKDVSSLPQKIYDDVMEVSGLFKSKDEQATLDKNIGDQELPLGYDDASALLPDFFKLA